VSSLTISLESLKHEASNQEDLINKLTQDLDKTNKINLGLHNSSVVNANDNLKIQTLEQQVEELTT